MVQTKAYKLAGLSISLVVPFIFIFFRFSLFHNPLADTMVKECIFWALFSALLLIVKYGEKEPFSSLGFNTDVLLSIGFGFVTLMGIYVVLMCFGVCYLLITHTRPPHEPLMEMIGRLPAWFKMLLAVRAGVVEETFFRAYAITRLQQLTNNKAIAVGLPLILFALGHLAYGTLFHFLAAFVIGAVLTVSYLLTKNLVSNIIAHTLFDAIAMLLISVVKH